MQADFILVYLVVSVRLEPLFFPQQVYVGMFCVRVFDSELSAKMQIMDELLPEKEWFVVSLFSLRMKIAGMWDL